MVFTKEEKHLIAVLIEKELEHVKADFKKLMISNADYITKTSSEIGDLEFLKKEALYEEMLEKLKMKLGK
ncbi:hypothetical protein HOC01_00785 [archaeon]|jgi:hypothetical protein|nr:hypothetical protein [archaeon]MBT6698623.1 hypothetical protein [archaeon]